MRKTRVGVLISGRGSNMVSLVEAAKAADFPAEIALVVSNRPDAPGLASAAGYGIATSLIDHKTFENKRAFEAAVDAELKAADIEIVCLAGFMRLLSPYLLDAWHNRLINIHPSLLPSFQGLDTHARAIEAGAKIHGCTVHFVRQEVDCGPIIAQAAVPVLDGDSPRDLAARVLKAEHRLYPHALALIASGRARLDGERVVLTQPIRVQAAESSSPEFYVPALT